MKEIAAQRLRAAANAMKAAVLALKWIDEDAASKMAADEDAARKLADTLDADTKTPNLNSPTPPDA